MQSPAVEVGPQFTGVSLLEPQISSLFAFRGHLTGGKHTFKTRITLGAGGRHTLRGMRTADWPRGQRARSPSHIHCRERRHRLLYLNSNNNPHDEHFNRLEILKLTELKITPCNTTQRANGAQLNSITPDKDIFPSLQPFMEPNMRRALSYQVGPVGFKRQTRASFPFSGS